MKTNHQRNTKAGFTIFHLLVFILAAVPAAFIAKYFGEKRPGLIFFLCYVPLGSLLWGLTFVWVPRAVHRLKHDKVTVPDETE